MQVTYLGLNNTRFCILYVKINHYEVYLIVISRVIDPNDSGWQFCKNASGEYNFKQFLFGMGHDVHAFKVRIFTNDYKY